jgi:hypothetical protein
MDFSKLSDADLEAVANNDMSKVSDEGLKHIAGTSDTFNEKEAQPSISLGERMIAKNFGSTPEAMANYIKQEHPDMDVKVHEGEVFAKSPTDKDYKALDPKGFFGKGMFHPSTWDWKDFGDIPADVVAGIAQGAAGTAGAAAGLPGAAAATAGATAGTEALKQMLGDKLGIPDNYNLKEGLVNTAIGGATPGVGKLIGKVAAPVGEAVANAGKGIYNSAFDKVDRALMTKYGKSSIADILREKGFVGGMNEAAIAADKINKETGQELGRLREHVGNLGGIETPTNYSRAESVIDKYKGNPNPRISSIGEKLQQELEAIKGNAKPQYPNELSTQRSVMRDVVGGDSAFDQAKTSVEQAQKQFDKGVMGSMADAEDAAMKNKLRPEEYDLYRKLKKDYSSTTQFTQNKLNQVGGVESNKIGAMPGAMDIMFATMADGPRGLWGLAAKKSRDIYRMTPVKTRLGLGTENLGKYMQDGLQTQLQNGKAIPPQVWIDLMNNANKESSNEK